MLLGNTQTLDAKAALNLWTDTANRRLLEAQRSEPFLQTQAALIRATTELRMAQQELVEHFGKQYGFPTRTELDDVHRSLTELRRELRAMQREQRKACIANDACRCVQATHATARASDRRQAQEDRDMTEARPSPATVLSDAADFGTKMLTGGQLLHGIRDADVQIATAPKELVWRQDKVSLYRFRPLAERRISVPMLIC